MPQHKKLVMAGLNELYAASLRVPPWVIGTIEDGHMHVVLDGNGEIVALTPIRTTAEMIKAMLDSFGPDIVDPNPSGGS